MEVILKQTIDNLGQEGDIVKVKAGYARNYLIPQKKAATVNKVNLTLLKQGQEAIRARLERQKQSARTLSEKLSGITIRIACRVGEEDRLFGSVTAADITEELGAKGISVDRRSILLGDPIKTLGETRVAIKVGYQTTTEITVQVTPEENGDQD